MGMIATSSGHCPFCEVPPERVLEARVYAFTVLDSYPVSPGHSLIIPRRHVANLLELTPAEIRDIVRLIGSSRLRIDQDLGPTGYNIGVNIGRDAGQTVMHAHVHIIPRYPGDCNDPTGGVRAVIPTRARY
jgi:diadenosine tetraphosphate (Ap4A) HIT family hydrolase